MNKKFLKEYFTFSTSVRRGIYVLLVLIILIIFLPYIYHIFIFTNQQQFSNNDFKSFDCAFSLIKAKESKVYQVPESKIDPNKLTENQWIKFGLPSKTVGIITKFQKKGGRFFAANDLLKIYGFDTSVYHRIENYLVFPEVPKIKVDKQNKIPFNVKNEISIQEINSADTFELIKLPGIGFTLASRIIKYRKLLGGFVNTRQLLEVYGLTNDNFIKFSKYIIVDSNLVKKINLNTISQVELMKHPYIGKYKASVIIKYRNFKGKIESLNELAKNGILKQDEIDKLSNYFIF